MHKMIGSALFFRMIHPDEVFPPYTLRVFSNAFTRTDIHFRPSQGNGNAVIEESFS